MSTQRTHMFVLIPSSSYTHTWTHGTHMSLSYSCSKPCLLSGISIGQCYHCPRNCTSKALAFVASIGCSPLHRTYQGSAAIWCASSVCISAYLLHFKTECAMVQACWHWRQLSHVAQAKSTLCIDHACLQTIYIGFGCKKNKYTTNSREHMLDCEAGCHWKSQKCHQLSCRLPLSPGGCVLLCSLQTHDLHNPPCHNNRWQEDGAHWSCLCSKPVRKKRLTEKATEQ
jgi:hypothetical protein